MLPQPYQQSTPPQRKSYSPDTKLQDGKKFEASLLSSSSPENFSTAAIKVLSEFAQALGLTDKDTDTSIAKILSKSGQNINKPKYRSLKDFLRQFLEKLNSETPAEGWYNFDEFLVKLPKMPTLASRAFKDNIALRISAAATSNIPKTVFMKTLENKISDRKPGYRVRCISGLGGPLDHLQKTDFVIVLEDSLKNISYYSFDLTLNTEKEQSLVTGVNIITPEDLDASSEERMNSCIDKVLSIVV